MLQEGVHGCSIHRRSTEGGHMTGGGGGLTQHTQSRLPAHRTKSFHTPQFRNTANGYRCLHQIISHTPIQKHSKWLQVFAPNHFTHPNSETQQMVTGVRTKSFHTPQFRNTANGYRCLHQIISHTPVQKHSKRLQVFAPNHFTHPSSETSYRC